MGCPRRDAADARKARMQEKSSRSAPDGSAPGGGEARLDTDAPVATHRWRLGARLRNYFLTGLVVVGPVAITVYIAWYVINQFDVWVKPYIPKIYNPDNYLPFAMPGAGLLFANRCSWAHTVAAALAVLGRPLDDALHADEQIALAGRGDPHLITRPA